MAIEETRCPDCGAPMEPRTSVHGKFWGCTRYKQGCRGTRDSMGRSKRDREEAGSENPEPRTRSRWID